MRLLVVDDDTYVRIVLAIEVPDVQLTEASRISELDAAIAAGPPDAVIVDRRLPDGDGLEVVRRLRRHFTTCRIPIIVLTAGHDPAERAEVLRAGADEYLAKPIDGEILGRILGHLTEVPFDQRRQRRRREVSAEAAGRHVLDLRGAVEREFAEEQHTSRFRRARA
jgi:two-component system OmpR family response regulator